GQVFLVANVPGALRISAIDPVARTQMTLADIAGAELYQQRALAIGPTLYFGVSADGVTLWKSDATPAGTQPVRKLGEGVAAGYHSLVRLGGKFLFSGTNGRSGYEPWVSDGTEAGTFILWNIRPEAVIQGRTLDAATGLTVPNATVTLVRTYGTYESRDTSTISDDGGRYAFRYLEEGKAHLDVTSPTHLETKTAKFDLNEGVTMERDVALQRGATISGRVTDAAGAPVAGVPIEVAEAFGAPPAVTTVTNTDGRYAASLPGGG